MNTVSSKNSSGRTSSRLLCLAGAAVVLAGCGPTGTLLAEQNPERADKVRHVCSDVMGFEPVNIPYRTCFDSLMQSLADSDRVAAVEHNREACAQQGLHAGTPEFAVCVVDRNQRVSLK